MKRRYIFAVALGIAVVLGAFQVAGRVDAAQSRGSQPGPEAMAGMMKMHERMMAEMKAGDAKLDGLVKEMNTASGNAKVAAIAVVVNELAAQHKAMHEHMGQMHQQMMGGRGMMMNR